MNRAETEIRNKAAEYAHHLLEYARAYEPEITEAIQKIAVNVEAEIVGLEHKFKTVESLTRKLAENSLKNIKKLLDLDYLLEEAIEETVKIKAEDVNDALRYTFAFSDEKYIFGFKSSLHKLEQNGFTIPEDRIWNAWKNIGTLFDKGYRGINVTVFSSHRQIFELQFHTAESFGLKSETHFLYEELRMSKTTRQRKNEIVRILIEKAQIISVPKGVRKL